MVSNNLSVDLSPFLIVLWKTRMTHGKPTFHSNIATRHLSIAVEHIKSQMAKTPWFMDRSYNNRCNAIMLLLVAHMHMAPSTSEYAHNEAWSPSVSPFFSPKPPLADNLTQFGQIGRGRSMSPIQIGIWSQACFIGFKSWLIFGHARTSTSVWSRNTTISRATCGGALSCTNTKFHPKTPLAHGSMWSLGICM